MLKKETSGLLGRPPKTPRLKSSRPYCRAAGSTCCNRCQRIKIVLLLKRALIDKERGLGASELQASDEVLGMIASYSSGDARSAYSTLEVAASLSESTEQHRLQDEIVRDALQKRVLLYDKAGEEHYNLISALHKSVRNSDPDAALY